MTVFTYGSGPTVLLVHGFPDHPLGLYDFAEAVAAHGYHCVLPVLPGFWLSEPPPDGDFSARAIGQDLLRVLDSLEVSRAAYVGHDWGAELGYALMGAEPSRFTTFTALGTPHPLGYRIRRTVLQELRTAWYALFLAYAPQAAEVARGTHWLTALVQSWSPGCAWPHWSEIVESYQQPGVMESVCQYYNANLSADLSAPTVTMPSLLIHGGQDGCISPNNYVDLPDHFPGGVNDVLLPTVGHWPHLEASEATLELLVDHLELGHPA